MGGVKKKSTGSSEKSAAASNTDATKKEESKKGGIKQKQKLSVLVEEPQGMKALQSMKAITIQNFARNIGVKISVANAFVKSLESKGILTAVGGYSGHRVYQLIKR